MSARGVRRAPLLLRSILYFGLAYLVLIVALGWLVSQSAANLVTDRLLDQLESAAKIAVINAPDDDAAVAVWVEEASVASGYRFTVIDGDGTVVADSHADAESMANHADRPEVAAALTGEVGRETRSSDTTGFQQLYVAVPADEGLVLRISVSARALTGETWPYRSSIILISIVAGIVGLAVVAWLARRVTRHVTGLTRATLALAGDGATDPIARSNVLELDELGLAVSRLDAAGKSLLHDAEGASSTLEVVLGALPQGTILLDEDDVVVYANPSAYELLGAVPDTLSGLIPFSFQEVVQDCRRTRVPTSAMAEHGKPVRTLRALASPFAEDRRVLLVVVDVTDRERSASVRRDFVANASHELKTPVSSIIASSEALRTAVERGDESSLRFATHIEESARQLDRLVADLLDLSRLERDQPEMAPIRLDHLLREEIERVRPAADRKGIALDSEIEQVRVAGSRRDLAIAIRNLLDNAIRYTGDDGAVATALSADDGEVRLVVSDTGDGIPTRDLTRVFERFYRLDNARSRATGGTGLGLAIVKHVVESHGGSVGVESELGAGSRFTVRLPVLEEVQD